MGSGGLEVTRSLGDLYFKNPSQLSVCEPETVTELALFCLKPFRKRCLNIENNAFSDRKNEFVLEKDMLAAFRGRKTHLPQAEVGRLAERMFLSENRVKSEFLKTFGLREEKRESSSRLWFPYLRRTSSLCWQPMVFGMCCQTRRSGAF